MPKSKRKRRSNNASGYFGVTLSGKRYCAKIKNNGKLEYIGTYNTARQAAKAYDAAAIELGSALSKLNFPKRCHLDTHQCKTNSDLIIRAGIVGFPRRSGDTEQRSR